MIPTVLRHLSEQSDGIITPVSSIDIRYFDLAEDVSMTKSVGRGGQDGLGEEGEAMKSEEESKERDIGLFHDFFLLCCFKFYDAKIGFSRM